MTSIAGWCDERIFGGFDALDLQIIKFRQLKDAYLQMDGCTCTDWCGSDPVNCSEK
jgi:hypothetical protein